MMLLNLSSTILLSSLISCVYSAPIEKRSEATNKIIAAALNHTQNVEISLEEAGLKLVTIPDFIKENVDLPEWLDSWEDAEFAAPVGQFEGVPLLGDHENKTIAAAGYLYSMAGGKWVTNVSQLGKRDGLDETWVNSNYTNSIMDFFQNGVQNQPEFQEVKKRAWQCFRGGMWNRNTRNMARIGALDALSQILAGSCDWINLNRSAICGESGGDIACVSWSGGWQSIEGCVAKAILNDAAGYFANGSEDFSGYMNEAINSNSKRTLWVDEACVSNRPNGCGSSNHQEELKKRGYNWNDNAYGWCASYGP